MTETKQSRAIFNWNMLSTFISQPETGSQECIIEYYVKHPDMLIIWSIFFQNMKVSN